MRTATACRTVRAAAQRFAELGASVERWDESWTMGLAGFAPQWCAHTFPHNFIGWPALAVPCGFVDGMPVSLQITGPPDGEALVYRAAHAFLERFPFDERPPTVS